MSLSIEQKKAVVSEVSAALTTARAGVLAEYRGLSVAQLTDLRARARRRGVWVRVVKNSLAKRIVAGSDFACLDAHFTGPVIFSAAEDPVAVAKVTADFALENDDFKITAGVMNGALIDLSTIGSLAKLPGRDELIAQLMAAMRAPLQTFVATLNEVPARLARTLAAVAAAKSQADAPGDAADAESNTESNAEVAAEAAAESNAEADAESNDESTAEAAAESAGEQS